MALAAGQRLGPYEIEGAVAKGGMGEIYRARDTRLARPVALKILNRAVGGDAGLRERFEREARAVAALQHPHICTLFDVGRDEQSDVSYLVMEYLDGETLRDRLARARSASGSSVTQSRAGAPSGALSVEQALRYAIEIADALDRAHRQGIVHRDIKPSNIMLTKGGAKLLDFGLAKTRGGGLVPDELETMDDRRSAQGAAPSLTAQGTMLGTLNYMAPEQVEGREADARTDIFALAAVTYEMLTGRRPFEGKSQASIIAAILEHEPVPVSTLQPLVPPALERILRQCLDKDPDERWQAAADLRRELAFIAESGSQPVRPAGAEAAPRKRWVRVGALGLAVAGALGGAGGAAYALWPEPVSPARIHLNLPVSGMHDTTSFAISPDGRRLAYTALDGGRDVLWIRPLDAAGAVALAGTAGARQPFWSPDGRHVAFFAGGQLKRVDAAGGVAQVLCAAEGGPHGGSWGSAGTIVFSAGPGELRRLPESGGAPTPIFPDVKTRLYVRPSFLPDGRRFVFSDATWGATEKEILLGAVDGGIPVSLVKAHSAATFSPDGFVLYVRNASLLALPFDLGRGMPAGDAVPIADGVEFFSGTSGVAFSASREGTLVFRNHLPTRNQFVWVDRTGKLLGTLGEPLSHASFDLDRSGKRVVFASRDSTQGATKLWMVDAERGVTSLLPTGERPDVNDPVWSPDGTRIAFTVRGPRPVIAAIAAAGGGASTLVEIPGAVPVMEDWSRDGRFVAFNLYVVEGDRSRRAGIASIAGDKKLYLVGEGATEVDELRFSPDGRHVAYSANEAGVWQVYVAPLPPTGARWQISTDGGVQPRFRGDGRQLYYLSRDGAMMSVDLDTREGVQASAPRALWKTRLDASPYVDQYAVTADGERFLVNQPLDSSPVTLLNVVVNWKTALGRP